MSTGTEFSIPLGPGKYFLKQPKDEDGVALSGGSGTVHWWNADTGADLGTIAITWNAPQNRYQSTIPDSTVIPRVVGDLWRGDVLIDATTPAAKRHRDEVFARVRAQSSEV